jgi:hypothetical protein
MILFIREDKGSKLTWLQPPAKSEGESGFVCTPGFDIK